MVLQIWIRAPFYGKIGPRLQIAVFFLFYQNFQPPLPLIWFYLMFQHPFIRTTPFIWYPRVLYFD